LSIANKKGQYYTVRRKFLIWYENYYLKYFKKHKDVKPLIKKAFEPYQVSFFSKLKKHSKIVIRVCCLYPQFNLVLILN